MTSNVSDLVKVKPLQWRGRYDKYDGGKEYYGHGVFGHWYAVERAKAKVWHCMHHVAGEVVHLGYFTSLDEAKAAAQHDFESRILAALTPAEQCFSVKEGYDVDAWDARRCLCPLSDSLTIRSEEEVRREALAAIENIPRYGHEYDPEYDMDYVVKKDDGIYLVREDVREALIDTPAPSTNTTPSVAEADNRIERICRELRNAGYMVPVSAMDRALAAQTGGE